jgi:hypothetical protein
MTFVDAINEKSARSTVSLTAGRGRVNNLKYFYYLNNLFEMMISNILNKYFRVNLQQSVFPSLQLLLMDSQIST